MQFAFRGMSDALMPHSVTLTHDLKPSPAAVTNHFILQKKGTFPRLSNMINKPSQLQITYSTDRLA